MNGVYNAGRKPGASVVSAYRPQQTAQKPAASRPAPKRAARSTAPAANTKNGKKNSLAAILAILSKKKKTAVTAPAMAAAAQPEQTAIALQTAQVAPVSKRKLSKRRVMGTLSGVFLATVGVWEFSPRRSEGTEASNRPEILTMLRDMFKPKMADKAVVTPAATEQVTEEGVPIHTVRLVSYPALTVVGTPMMSAIISPELMEAAKAQLATALRAQTTEMEATRAKAAEDARLKKIADAKAAEARAEAARLAAIEAAPVCQSPMRGGNLAINTFRSAAQMKEYGVTLDSTLAMTAEGCKITVREALSDMRISRLPFIPNNPERSKRLFEQFKACLVENGFQTKRFISAAHDKGLVFPPSRISEHETARGEGRGMGYDCSVSWGRDRVDDAHIARLMKKKRPMPSGDWGGAMGAFQLMYFGLEEQNIDNPFDRADASAGARRYSASLQPRCGGHETGVRICYNGGVGAYFTAVAACGRKDIRPECISNPQTRAYAGIKKHRNTNTAETVVATDEQPKTLIDLFRRQPLPKTALSYSN